MAGLQHSAAHHRCLHLRHQRETLLCLVSVAFCWSRPPKLSDETLDVFPDLLHLHRKANVSGSEPYSSLPPEAVVGNSLGALLVAFALVVLHLLWNSSWQRPESRPEGWQRPESRPKDTTYTVRRSLVAEELLQWNAPYFSVVSSISQPLLQEDNE